MNTKFTFWNQITSLCDDIVKHQTWNRHENVHWRIQLPCNWLEKKQVTALLLGDGSAGAFHKHCSEARGARLTSNTYCPFDFITAKVFHFTR